MSILVPCIVTMTVTLLGYLLMVGRSFFLPLTVAGALAYLVITMANGLRRISFRGFRPPFFLALLIVITGFLVASRFLVTMIISNITLLVEVIPSYQEKLLVKVERLYDLFGISLATEYTQIMEKVDLVWITSIVFHGLSEIASNTGLIALYFLFIVIESSFFREKMNALFTEERHLNEGKSLLEKASLKMNSYIRIKTFLSVVTGLSSYLVLLLVGVDFAEFGAFLIFLLNYIPTIGSIIATIFPCIIATVQFDSLTPLVIVALSLTGIQLFIGNILEPRIMGRSFNLSPLVILLSLTVWGSIWGVVGMFLSVPIMVLLSIVLANFPSSRWIAVLLSRDGRVE